MATARVGTSSLDVYREEADRFIAALEEEFYLHYAGLKDEFDVVRIYERFSELTSLATCRSLQAVADEHGDAGTRELWRFGCEGHLGRLTREQTEEISRLEATLSAEVDGERIPFRMLRPSIANEPDRARRERLEQARNQLVELELNPLHVRIAETRRDATRELGFSTYRELYARFGFRLDALAAQCERFLEETEDVYVRSCDRLLQARLGLRLERASRWDLPRLFRATDWDAGFPADEMLPALVGTLADLGIDLPAQKNIELDVEPRPKKSPRAFCSPIEVPARVVLVIKPIGGADDWHALFHEAGHAEHYAHTPRDLRVEERRLGDLAVTEGWAALLHLLVADSAWLARRLDFGRPHEFAAEAAVTHLYLARRYAAKLLYELELHDQGDLEAMRDRYVERLSEATKIVVSGADFLADVDPGFYSSAYLRAWGFEAQLRTFLREEFGSAWFARRETGSLLRELWSEGQRLTADDLLHEVTGGEIELAAVAERIEESL
ncbi:MAG: hypothetical protein M3312_10260 [Actinomycetota bacterium]|nr:hypothetical protein [Actinomycetota bacterium]